MRTASTRQKRPELTFEALPPERPVLGPKLPRHLAVIPEWVEPDQSKAGPVWSAEAEARLGAKFDVKAFHAVVLGAGAVTLPVLDDRVRAWMANPR